MRGRHPHQFARDGGRAVAAALRQAATPKPELILVGTDGNAFSVLGKAFRAAKAAGWTQEQRDEYKTKATSGDYDNLLAVTMEYFDVQ
jgi:hypothetical protein